MLQEQLSHLEVVQVTIHTLVKLFQGHLAVVDNLQDTFYRNPDMFRLVLAVFPIIQQQLVQLPEVVMEQYKNSLLIIQYLV